MLRKPVRMIPLVVLITGVVILGFALSLQVYSYFHPKQGVMTITLNSGNNYSVVQLLSFNYHGYVEARVLGEALVDRVNIIVDSTIYTLNNTVRGLAFILGRGDHVVYFSSINPAVIRLSVEDFLIVPGENNILMIAGIVLSLVGLASTIYYARRNLIPVK